MAGKRVLGLVLAVSFGGLYPVVNFALSNLVKRARGLTVSGGGITVVGKGQVVPP